MTELTIGRVYEYVMPEDNDPKKMIQIEFVDDDGDCIQFNLTPDNLRLLMERLAPVIGLMTISAGT